MKKYQGKKVLVWGGGMSGKAAASYLIEEGAEVSFLDKKRLTQTYECFLEESPPAFGQFDFCVKSPGIPPTHRLHGMVEKAMPILSEIELACRHLQEKKKYLLGITGSNGKTTTTLFTEYLLNQSGKKALAVGNVGIPFISQVSSDADVFVVELSSFQLELLQGTYFHAGVILNITPNHLDRYQSFEEYVRAKLRLQECILPNGVFYLNASAHPICQPFLTREAILFNPPALGEGVAKHDQENMHAARLLCQELQISEEVFRESVKSFKKPPHRLECVLRKNGITYINDSKATSVDAVIKAVEALDAPILLIAGGVDKGGNFKEWIPFFRNKVKKVLAIGKAAERISQEIRPAIKVELCNGMHEAVKNANLGACEGDIILLSPGCSSYDSYKDYLERGNHFKAIIREEEV